MDKGKKRDAGVPDDDYCNDDSYEGLESERNENIDNYQVNNDDYCNNEEEYSQEDLNLKKIKPEGTTFKMRM